jgi:hypothetical protein
MPILVIDCLLDSFDIRLIHPVEFTIICCQR